MPQVPSHHAHAAATPPVTLRAAVRAADVDSVRTILESSNYFRPDEVDVGVELVQERLAKGDASGYHFIILEQGQSVLGYACFGPIACTLGSFDLYWIAVHESQRGRGFGRILLDASESRAKAMGARAMYIETSSRPLYAPTQQFYLRCGYREEARLTDFYSPGDSKIIYVKPL